MHPPAVKERSATALGYEATVDKGKRQAPTNRLLSEDKHLNVADRKKLIATRIRGHL